MSKNLYLSKMKLTRKYLREHMTGAEAYLWTFIRRHQLGFKFRRQVSIGYFIVDFYCKEISLAIEVDGGIHLQQDIQERDRLRQEILESDNVFILRFTNDEILRDIHNALDRIKEHCTRLSKTRSL